MKNDTFVIEEEVKRLADALDAVERCAARTVARLRADPTKAERLRLARLLGMVATEMFSDDHAPVFPSNLLDVVSAWLDGHKIGHGHSATEEPFLAAVARAEAKLAERAA